MWAYAIVQPLLKKKKNLEYQLQEMLLILSSSEFWRDDIFCRLVISDVMVGEIFFSSLLLEDYGPSVLRGFFFFF